MKRNIIRNVILIALIIVFIFSVFKTSMFFLEVARDQNTNDQLVEEVTSVETTKTEEGGEEEKFTVDYASLLAINADVRGWIRYPKAEVNYPIVQGEDNDFYLDHDYYKKKNLFGSIFMDHRNSGFEDRNTVIFGHNTTNGSMFGSLKKVMDDGYFERAENRYIDIINTKNETLRYEIFSVYVIPEEEYYITTEFANDKEFQEFLNTIAERSERALPAVSGLSGEDKVLTLSTCNDLRVTNKRLVIHAKLIK